MKLTAPRATLYAAFIAALASLGIEIWRTYGTGSPPQQSQTLNVSISGGALPAKTEPPLTAKSAGPLPAPSPAAESASPSASTRQVGIRSRRTGTSSELFRAKDPQAASGSLPDSAASPPVTNPSPPVTNLKEETWGLDAHDLSLLAVQDISVKAHLTERRLEIRKAAEQGNPTAQFLLGVSYQFGFGTSVDIGTALVWYGAAADKGFGRAQHAIGYLTETSLGLPQNYSEAFIWYKKAADQGLAISQFSLGLLSEKGLGVSADFSSARSWYDKAASQGYAPAESAIGRLSLTGGGGRQDFTEAMQRFIKAEDLGGDSLAEVGIGTMYAQGLGVAKDSFQAREWFERGAKKGNPTAQVRLGGVV